MQRTLTSSNGNYRVNQAGIVGKCRMWIFLDLRALLFRTHTMHQRYFETHSCVLHNVNSYQILRQVLETTKHVFELSFSLGVVLHAYSLNVELLYDCDNTCCILITLIWTRDEKIPSSIDTHTSRVWATKPNVCKCLLFNRFSYNRWLIS